MQTIATPNESYRAFLRRSLLIACPYLLTLAFSITQFVVLDPDLGWHLASGQWITEQGLTPVTDPFSLYGQDKPWVAYSWLFEVVIYTLFKAFGYLGIFLFMAILSLGITTALLELIRKIEPNPVLVIGLTSLSLFSMGPILTTPRPWLFSILFFIIELDILLTVRRTGHQRYLLILPVLFALWANLHIQFVYGLFMVGVLLIEPIIESFIKHAFSKKTIKSAIVSKTGLIVLLCFVSTLVTPYHIHLWGTVIDIIGQQGPYHYVSELQAMSFRSLTDWVVLGLTLWAAYLLGQTKIIRPFPVIIFIVGVFISFRTVRDVWFVSVSSITIIASMQPMMTTSQGYQIRKIHALMILLIMSLFLIIWIPIKHLTNSGLTEAIAKQYPLKAVEFIKAHGYPGPLYNFYDWGGFLIWHLPQLLVSIDGRANLHGDERLDRYVNKTWNGSKTWADDPELALAKLIIANVNMPLSSLLKSDKRFNMVYEDAVATVFIAKPAHE